MLKKAGEWQDVDWEEALEFAAAALQGRSPGILASPHATLEELHLAGRLARAMKGAADFRLRHCDFSADGARAGIPWLGMAIPELEKLDRVLVIGSFLRKEHPLIAHRLRQAVKRGAQIHKLHSADDDWLIPLKSRTVVAPSELPEKISSCGDLLAGGKNMAILVGNFAQQHPQAARIHAAAAALAKATGAKLGFLTEAANSAGGYVAGLPVGHAAAALEKSHLVLLNVEPELDCADPQAARAGLERAEVVISLTAWRTGLEYADLLLPIAPFTETPGTFINMEGRVQSFYATVHPLGEARPAWKVLRVLGTLLGLQGFEEETIEQVREACLQGRDIAKLLSNEINLSTESKPVANGGLQRIADVPIYFADPLTRRSPPLQKTPDAQAPRAWMNSKLMALLGLAKDDAVLVKQGRGHAKLKAALDDKLPDGCVRVAAAHPSTADLGAMFGALTVDYAVPLSKASYDVVQPFGFTAGGF